MSDAAVPATMRGVVRRRFGTAWADGVLDFASDLPVPAPARGQVLVRVHAAALNAGDVKAAAGYFKAIMAEKLPRVPGMDLAGVVVALGPGVSEFAVGHEVFGDAGFAMQGTLAEYAVADVKALAPKPPALTFVEAAALPVAGATALQGVRIGGVRAGMSVAVRGASGGVGSYVVQLTKAFGAARVIGVSSAVPLVTSIGADEVIDYTKTDWAEALAGRKLDVVLDCAGDGYAGAKRAIKRGGHFVPVSATDLQKPVGFGFVLSMVASTLARKFLALFGGPAYDMFVSTRATRPLLETLAGLAQERKLRPVIAGRAGFSKAGAVQLYEQLASGRAKGKLVMVVRE